RPSAGSASGPSVPRVAQTCPTTTPSTSATSDSGGSHASLVRRASTSPGSTGAEPGGAIGANASEWTAATAGASPGSSRRTSTGTRSAAGDARATGFRSPDVAQLRPQLRPRDAPVAGDEDRLALLVVVQAEPVVDPGGELAAAEPPAQRRLVHPDHDQGVRLLRRRAPGPVRVVPAVGGGERRQEPVDRARLAVVAREHGDPLARGQPRVDVGDRGGELGPADRLARVVVD